MKTTDMLIKYFNWTEQDVKNKKNILYHLASTVNEAEVLKNVIQLQKQFGLNKAKTIRLIKVFPSFLCMSEDLIKDKLAFLNDELKLDKNGFTYLIKVLPSILGLSKDKIKGKVAFYQKELNITTDEFVKMLTKLPTMLGYSEESVLNKLKFYQHEFNIGQAELFNLVKVCPHLFSFNEDTIKDKIKLYQEALNLDKAEFVCLLKKQPILLCYSETNIKGKLAQFADLGITKYHLMNDQTLLSVPNNTMKIRYMILKQVASREEILRKKCVLINNQNKLYARIAFFKNETQKEFNLNDVTNGEKRFTKKYKVSSDDLMKKYKLTKEKIYSLQGLYDEQEVSPFNQSENEYIDNEYGISG